MKKIQIYDTTLRDGTQAEEINLSTEDKLRIALELDGLGVDYIEGGWPGSNVTDEKFFEEIRRYDLKHARIAAFGSTHNPKKKPETDDNLAAIVKAQSEVATIFGKTWKLHVTEALRVSLKRNLELIAGSTAFLKKRVKEVIFDAEHFFDGFKADRAYALKCLKTAADNGAKMLVLCDTNGGCMPHEIRAIVEEVVKAMPKSKFGIHVHNDSDTAVASSIEAVRAGCIQVQGTINGYGERCGNANLCSIIPILALKSGGEYGCLSEGKLSGLTAISNFVSEVCNLRPFMRQPYVGRSAFAHKGGIHVSAVLKDARTYEHIDPKDVGNVQRVLLSDLSGRSNILYKAKKFGYDLDKDDPAVMDLLAGLKERESQGYDYSAAEASYELLFHRSMGWSKQYFKLLNFRVVDAMSDDHETPFIEATVMVKVRGHIEHTAATGQGPVNALDNALRKALDRFYPCLGEMRLSDFKVRVLSGTMRDTGGTASFVRVLIESHDKHSHWTTIGVSYDVIEASWQALVDSVNYKLFKDDPKKWPVNRNPDFKS